MKVVCEGIVLALATALSVAACNPDQAAVQTSEAAGASGANKGFIIRNASLVLTMDPKLGSGTLGELHDVDVLIQGDHIAAVGANLSARGAQVIDGEGKIVMPGFIDTHDHLWQSLIRGCAADENVNGWLNRCVFPFDTARSNGGGAGVRASGGARWIGPSIVTL